MKKIFAGLLFSILSFSAFAETAVPKLISHFNDLAGTVAPHLHSQIESRLSDFEKATSNQVVILTVPSLDEDEISSFSQRVFESWKLGQKGKDNGVLIMVIKDRVDKDQGKSIRIHPGRGLEGSLPDITCRHIVVDFMKPLMKEGKYTEGLNAGIDKIIAATKGEYTPQDSDVPTDKAESASDFPSTALFIIGIVVFLIASVIMAILGGFSAAIATFLLLPASVDGGLTLTFVVIAFVIGWGIGWVINQAARSGSFSSDSSWDWGSGGSSSSSGGDFGGFSGGGGDSSGGGGGD